jgi:hypothetical protein
MAERRIVIFEWMTADGYFTDTDGGLDWVVPDDAQARASANDIGRFDTVLTSSSSGAARSCRN